MDTHEKIPTFVLCHRGPSPKGDEQKWWIFFFREPGFAAEGLWGEDSTRRVTSARSGGQEQPRTESGFHLQCGPGGRWGGPRRGLGEGRTGGGAGGSPDCTPGPRLAWSSNFHPGPLSSPAGTAEGVHRLRPGPLSAGDAASGKAMRQVPRS